WVKPQIDELLSEARQALEAYAEDPEDAHLMQSCVGLLHQVLGTLRMVELYGAAELDQEMEHLAQSVLDGKVSDRDEALGALMRGVVQLPDYLDLIESGHKATPAARCRCSMKCVKRAAPNPSTSACCSIRISIVRCRRMQRVRVWRFRSPTCASAPPGSGHASKCSCWPGRRASNPTSRKCAIAWMSCAPRATPNRRAGCGGSPAACWKPCSRVGWITILPACASSSGNSIAPFVTCRTRARKSAAMRTRANSCAACCSPSPTRRPARAAPKR